MAKKKVKKKAAKTLDEGPGFEQSLARLEDIAAELEKGALDLEKSLAMYEEGVGLLRRCNSLLSDAQRRIELLSGFDAEGNPLSTPVDDQQLSLAEKAQNRSRRRTAKGDSSKTSLQLDLQSESDVDEQDDIDDSGRLF